MGHHVVENTENNRVQPLQMICEWPGILLGYTRRQPLPMTGTQAGRPAGSKEH
jgi:hypothetical protein